MLKCRSQMNFVFMIYLILQLKCGILQENGASDESNILPNILQENIITEVVDAFNTSPKQRCEPQPRTCYKLQYFGRFTCEKKYKPIPQIDHDFSTKEVYTLTYTHIRFLPPGAFLGICIDRVTVDDSYTLVDENVFEGTVRLLEWIVKRSFNTVIILPNL